MTIIEQLQATEGAIRAKALAKLLGCSPSKLTKMTHKPGRIPFFRLGGMILFDPQEIAIWLQGKSDA